MSKAPRRQTMDFFGRQKEARWRTVWLACLLIFVVAIITLLVYPIFAFFVAWVGPYGGAGDREPDWPRMWAMMRQWEMFVGVTIGTALLICGGALIKILKLARGGGASVAEALGGRLLPPDTRDPNERKLLNVVEEMAIASGMTVPPVYVMDNERSINAFAAGTKPENAVVGVTRGAIEALNRDELQGVVAHEFSHILNGDMRVNIRLIGVVHGLMIIALIGYGLMASGSRRRYRSRRDSNASSVLIGLILVGIGLVGVFFARVIKAAVSRQREFLADAAAVQFTRNPGGLSGALKKIGGLTAGSRLKAERAEEASHMYFGRGVGLSGLLSTHPPLKKRIRRIEPNWDGSFPRVTLESSAPEAKPREEGKATPYAGPHHGPLDVVLPREVRDATGAAAGGVLAGAALGRQIQAAKTAGAAGAGASMVEQTGQPTPKHLEYAKKLREAIPESIREGAREPGAGRAIVYSLLLKSDKEVRDNQLQRLKEHAESEAYEMTARLAPQIVGLGDELRLPLIDIAMPILRTLSTEQYQRFRGNMDALIKADGRVSVFEWMLRRVVLHHLEPQFSGRPRPKLRYFGLPQLPNEMACLLSSAVYLGAKDKDQAQKMYQAGAAKLSMKLPPMWSGKDCNFKALDEALDKLSKTGPRDMQTALEACAACIAANEQVTPREAEFLRAISDTFGAPMPPLLPGQPIG